MVKLLRHFSVISLLGLTAIAVMLNWLHHQQGLAQLTRLTEHQHTALAQVAARAWRANAAAGETETALRRHLDALPLIMVRGYDSNGKVIFGAQLATTAVANQPLAARFITAADSPHSWLEKDTGRVVSVIPLPYDDNRDSTLAAIELRSDVVPQLLSIDETNFLKGVVVVFALLYSAGVVAARRLSALLNRQQQSLLCNEKTLREKARQLEQAINQRKQAEQALKVASGKLSSA